MGLMGGAAGAAGGGLNPAFSNVQLLLHCNGSNGSTTFTDSSSSPKTVTAQSGAIITTAQSVYGGASGDCTANTTTRFEVSANNALRAIGEFSLEFWIRFTDVTSVFNLCLFAWSGTSIMYMDFASNGVLRLNYSGGNLSFGAVSASTWYHLAIARDNGNTMRLFKNGVAQASATHATDMSAAASMSFGTGQAVGVVNGYARTFWDDIRLAVGECIYTANFTPPSGQFPDG